MEDRIIVRKDDDAPSISTSYSGIYSEDVIVNGTSSDIVIITNDNRRAVLKPDNRNQNNGVTIISRMHNGEREVLTPMGERPVGCKQIHTFIPKDIIERSHYYDESQDIVIAPLSIGSSINHPNAKKNYTDILKDICKTLTTDSTRIIITVNDPLRRIKEVFCCIDEHLFKVVCTSVRDNKNKGLLTLSIIISDGMDTTTHVDCMPIEDLYTNGSIFINQFGRIFAFGTSPENALNCFKNKKEEEIIELEKLISQRAAETRKLEDEKSKIALQEKDLTIKKIKNELEACKADIKQSVTEIELLKNDILAKDCIIKKYEENTKFLDTSDKRHFDLKKSQYSVEEEYYKLEKAKEAAKETTVRIWTGVASAIVATVITTAITAYFKNK